MKQGAQTSAPISLIVRDLPQREQLCSVAGTDHETVHAVFGDGVVFLSFNQLQALQALPGKRAENVG